MPSTPFSKPFSNLFDLVGSVDFKERLLCLYKQNFNSKLERHIQDMLADVLNRGESLEKKFQWFTEVEEVDLVCIGSKQIYPATSNNIEIKYQFPYDRGCPEFCVNGGIDFRTWASAPQTGS